MVTQALQDFMELEYVDLVEGTTRSGCTCPVCRERGVMSVSRIKGNLLWLCHRASCSNRKGSKYSGSIPSPKGETRKVEYPVPIALPEPVRLWLEENYELSSRSINRAGIGFLPNWKGGDRLYMPIQDLAGKTVGYSAKVIESNIKPKVIIKNEHSHTLSWYINKTLTNNILVVEDQLSAIRASEVITSAALLGTHMNKERVLELMRFNPTKILLALDADAFDKAIKYMVEFRALTDGKMKVIKLQKDIKNMTHDEFLKFSINYLKE